MILKVVGLVSKNPNRVGIEVGAYEESLKALGMKSPVSGCTEA